MGLSLWQKALNTAQIKNFYDVKPAGLRWRSNTLFILVTVGVGLLTDLFLYSLLVPVLPFMLEDRIGLPQDQIQSHTSGLLAAYAGASVVFSPLAGVLADKVSTRQSPFLLGLASLLAATGISSAFVWTIGLALCIETVGPDNLGKTIGTIFSFVSAGSLWAPFIGGLLYQKAGYPGVFGVAFGVIGIDFVLRTLMIEKKVANRYDEDIKSGMDEDANGAPAGQSNGERNGNNGNDEEQPLLPKDQEDGDEFKLSENQPRIAKVIPILPCLTNPSLLTALVLALVQALLLGSCDATIATVSRELFGFDSLKAGVMYLPLGLTDLIVGPFAGWCVDRYGTKPVAVVSFAFTAPVLVLLRLPHAGGIHQIVLYGGLLALLGVGLSATGAPSIVEAGAIVKKYHDHNKGFFGESGPYAQLYGMNSMMFNLGLTIGPELSGELKDTIGYGNMNIVLAVICAVTAVLSFFYIGGKPRMLKKRDL